MATRHRHGRPWNAAQALRVLQSTITTVGDGVANSVLYRIRSFVADEWAPAYRLRRHCVSRAVGLAADGTRTRAAHSVVFHYLGHRQYRDRCLASPNTISRRPARCGPHPLLCQRRHRNFCTLACANCADFCHQSGGHSMPGSARSRGFTCSGAVSLRRRRSGTFLSGGTPRPPRAPHARFAALLLGVFLASAALALSLGLFGTNFLPSLQLLIGPDTASFREGIAAFVIIGLTATGFVLAISLPMPTRMGSRRSPRGDRDWVGYWLKRSSLATTRSCGLRRGC